MDDLALLITMDIEGRLYIEATVPSNFVNVGEDTASVRIPIPPSVAPKIGRALIDAAAAVPDGVKMLEN